MLDTARAGRRDIWLGETLEKLKLWCAEKLTAGQMVVKFREEFGINFTRSAIIGKVHRTPGIALNFAHGKESSDAVQPNRGGDHKAAQRIKRRAKAAIYMRLKFQESPDEPEPLRLSVADSGFDAGCKWVCEGTNDLCLPVHCGNPSVAESSWCAHHYRRVFA